MTQYIQNIIDLSPYKVELAVIDYQDEGYKLDIFVWKDLINLADVSSLTTGNLNDLQNKMIEVYNYLITNNINCDYTLDIEVC